jgi:hypothetical protein
MRTEKESNHIKYLERTNRLESEYPIIKEKAIMLAT